jgi:hypothetical protein
MPKTILLPKRMTKNIPFLRVFRKYHQVTIIFVIIYSISFTLNVQFISCWKYASEWVYVELYNTDNT